MSQLILVNAITATRVLLSIYIFGLKEYENTALGLLILALSTDFIDGFLARHWSIETRFGKEFDQLADKFVFHLLFFKLWILGISTIWFFLLFLARDIIISIIRFSRFSSRSINTTYLNKVKTACQFIILVIGFTLSQKKYDLDIVFQLICLSTVVLSYYPLYKFFTKK